MVFSATAPKISPGTEHAERRAFSEEEKARIYEDIHGPPVKCQGTKASSWSNDLKKNESLVNEAIESMQDKDKADYLFALEHAPLLVQKESCIVDFLRIENGNPQAAAKRLVDYWKIRREIFGRQRAFLPMTLQGAMAEDIDVLKAGVIMLLPPDKHGRPVLFVKRCQLLPKNGSRESFARCFFYFYSVIAASEAGKKNGAVYIVHFSEGNAFKLFNRWLLKRNMAANNAIPFVSRALHLVNKTPNVTMRRLILPVIKQMVGKHNRHRLLVHAGHAERVLSILTSYGFEGKNLTADVGGDLSRREYATNWVGDQIRRERVVQRVSRLTRELSLRQLPPRTLCRSASGVMNAAA